MSAAGEVFLLLLVFVCLVGSAYLTYLAWFKSDYFETLFIRNTIWPWPRFQLWFYRIMFLLSLFVSAFWTYVMLAVFIDRVS
jgi:predicted MPP superfamily phosphohydrolase